MLPEAYATFTSDLTHNLESDQRVLGLVALGSMAHQDYQPDQWSDHDFFVIVAPQTQEAFRNDLRWLPRFGDVSFSFRETAHGVKVVYRDGHLLEFAIFDPNELTLAKVNRYRVLLDKADIAARLATVKAGSAPHESDSAFLFGQFLTNILVGVGRYRRGEKLSGHVFVKMYALQHLVQLLALYLPSDNIALLDNLDPFRRFEVAYPAVGQALNTALAQNTPEAARAFLVLARQELAARLPAYSEEAVAIIERIITESDNTSD